MADFSKGWITLLRSIQDHELWQRKPFGKGQAWIDLILSANHKENKIMLGNTIHEIQRGEFITSQRKLAEKWGWSRNTVKTFLNLLRSRAMIELKTTHEMSHLTITNYNHLQKTSTTNKATKEPPLEPPKSHHLSTNKECNNEKNKKSIYTPPTLEEVDNYCKEANLAIQTERFVDFYESKGWMVGKNKMKDWRAAVRNWARAEPKQPPPLPPPKPKEPLKPHTEKEIKEFYDPQGIKKVNEIVKGIVHKKGI